MKYLRNRFRILTSGGTSLILFLTVLSLVAIAAGTIVILDFNSLPSAQGWSYTGAPESTVFSVSGGVLHQDTINVSGSLGFYRLPGVVGPSLPFVLSVRAAAIQQQGDPTASDSFIFGVDTGSELFAVALSPNRIEDALGNALSTTVDNTSFHDYRLEGTPGVGYQLYRDTILVGSGPPRVIAGVNSLFFGDATTGPDAIGDISSYSFVHDSDIDGVFDDADVCPTTVIPESVPTKELKPNHWALVDGDTAFDTVSKGNGNGPNRSYTTTDTAGCSCEQIIEELGLGEGHTKHGCSISVMDDWVAQNNP